MSRRAPVLHVPPVPYHMKNLARRLAESPSWRELRAIDPFMAREVEVRVRRARLRRWLDANLRALKATAEELGRTTGERFLKVSERFDRLLREGDELSAALYPEAPAEGKGRAP